MKTNAIAIANEFIALAKRDNKSIRHLALMKLVYIAYGYALALVKRSVIDERFDVVQAWKLGPVIPSVYHTFKHYRNNPIQEYGVVATFSDNEVVYNEVKLEDSEVVDIVNKVWCEFGMKDDLELVSLLHQSGTPWAKYYKEGANVEIPENETKEFYCQLLKQPKTRKLNYRLVRKNNDMELQYVSDANSVAYEFPNDEGDVVAEVVRDYSARIIKPVEKWL